MNNERIDRLKAALFSRPREISLERALLYTESHRDTSGLTPMMRRAHAISHVLRRVEISIRDDELIAGNRTIAPRAGIISPEMDPYWILDELDQFETRPQDPFLISDHSKSLYREKLFPYWRESSMKDFINAQIPETVREAIATRVFSINQTDKGQGHIIVDYPLLLSRGLGELNEELDLHAKEHPENEFFAAAALLMRATRDFVLRYRDLAQSMADHCGDPVRRAELQRIADISTRIADAAPEDFHEACQLFWYVNIALQLESYQTSLEKGEDPEALQELLASLWIKMNDIVLLRSSSSARFFAGFPTGYTIVLGGQDEVGHNAETPLSSLCLQAYRAVQLPQPNLGVRASERISREFLLETAETIRIGTGIPQVFNDEGAIPAFLNRGVSLEDARDYAVVGCVELSIPGKTYGLHDIAMFNLLKIMELVLPTFRGDPEVSVPAIMERIESEIRRYVDLMVEGANICDIGHREWAPVPLLSSLVDDCLSQGKDITAGGARYNFSGVQGIGIANLCDSLAALEGYVFTEKRLSFDAMLDVLEANFEVPDGDKIRARLINRYSKYGNDIDAVDHLGGRLLRVFCKSVEKYRNPRGGVFSPGSYTVSAHVPLGAVVGATPDGRLSGEQLADGGLSPMAGRDMDGPSAVLNSVSKLDNLLLSNGSLLNLKFTPSTLAGDKGLAKLADFLRAFVKLKLLHVQFNVVDAETLREAQRRPEDFAGLIVRVAGYSAFFVELSQEIQDDIISRHAHQL
jgi:pyruvate formate-lyase/glycerol dehydratase family glycyl radical enzyme